MADATRLRALRLLAEGHTVTEVAQRTGKSIRTVRRWKSAASVGAAARRAGSTVVFLDPDASEPRHAEPEEQPIPGRVEITVAEGVPAGVPRTEAEWLAYLERKYPGRSPLSTKVGIVRLSDCKVLSAWNPDEAQDGEFRFVRDDGRPVVRTALA